MSSQRYAWVLNLDAELEMANEGPYQASARLMQQQEKYGAGAQALLGPDDCLLSAVPAAEVGSFLGRAWCVTPRALHLMHETGIVPEPHPDPAIVQQVNHRLFAHRLGGGLPDQHYVCSQVELQEILRERAAPWVLKRPLAFAGRGQQRILGTIDARLHNWIAASLKTDGLVIEPLVTPTTEFALHGYVQAGGEYALGRITVQTVSDRGVFRETRIATGDDITGDEGTAFRDQGAVVARALRAAGYFGPFGIDGYRYRDAHAAGFCRLGEVNARYTMAFAAGFGPVP